jgi:hypothetical protein
MDQTFCDIYDIWPLAWYENPWLCSAIVGTVIFFFVTLRYVCRSYRFRPAVSVSPENWLLQELERCLIGKTRDDHKLFYQKLTYCIKIYLQKRYNFYSAAMTDDEAVAYLKKTGVAPELLPILETIAAYSVNVKFGLMESNQECMQQHKKNLIACIALLIPACVQKSENCH